MPDWGPCSVGDGRRVGGRKKREGCVAEEGVDVEVCVARVTPLLNASGLEENKLHVGRSVKRILIVKMSSRRREKG